MWERPAPEDVWRAVDAYLAQAYDAAPPAPVAERLSRLRAVPEAAFYDCESFERGDDRYSLRLGNRFYPHMQLVVMGVRGGRALVRVDTHDRHFLDLVDASEALTEMMARNEAIARAIEAAWSASGLFTSREHLRDQVARFRAARS
jgi:hypothetical protein